MTKKLTCRDCRNHDYCSERRGINCSSFINKHHPWTNTCCECGGEYNVASRYEAERKYWLCPGCMSAGEDEW